MINYTLDLYRQFINNLKRGNTKGVFSNAKPIFMLSIIEYIPEITAENKLFWGDEKLEEIYNNLYDTLESCKRTPFWKPFFYMGSEPFYTLVWKNQPPEKLIRYPSGKTLKNYLDYAQLDYDLWSLLQNSSNREYLKNCIIKQYLSNLK